MQGTLGSGRRKGTREKNQIMSWLQTALVGLFLWLASGSLQASRLVRPVALTPEVLADLGCPAGTYTYSSAIACTLHAYIHGRAWRME
ncbi:hypothetical protein B0H63DRAFT_481945 [Podospora didyma]|uniref:Uncharacterized protein n=1 Tax=Podospora didyma TaxID=330526 RepID=A0AAE0KEQ7_9PEZI|nr:hypothetical protein B0H63DRAFT_481945 [Podospora didyma]